MFARALDVELEKISSFFEIKLRELLDEARQLQDDVGAFELGEAPRPRWAAAAAAADARQRPARAPRGAPRQYPQRRLYR